MIRPVLAAVAAAALCPAALGQAWQSLGPAPISNGQTSPSQSVSGAVQGILADPTNSSRLFVGTVNGGVWRTTDGGSSWTPLTDNLGSTSISALSFDPTDAANNTLVAGFGRTRRSSYFTEGGNRLGVTFSLDGGSSWTNKAISAGGPDVNGVIARGLGVGAGTIVTSSMNSNSGTSVGSPDYANAGIFRSTDGGNSWAHVSGGAGTGLPNMNTYGVFANPANATQLFTVPYNTPTGTGFGVYRSADTGASWSQVDAGNAALNTAIAAAENVRVSANGTTAFLGLVGSNGQLASLWRSTDGGSTFTQFGGTINSATTANPNGTNQTNPGGQGNLHFNLEADPTNSNRVYVTGDATQTSPFNGRVFRVDFSANTFTSLFANGTNAPHADGRALAVRADGALLAGNDGGIFSLANPGGAFGGNTWTSVNGNLGTLEIHSVAYDPVSKVAFGGAQDNGTSRQVAAGNTAWTSVLTGDGAQVAVVANPNNAAQSLRYMSAQFLGSFRRGTYDNTGAQVGSLATPALTVAGTGQSITAFDSSVQFYGPIATNRANGNNLFIGTRRVYESTDQGNTLTVLKDYGSGTSVTAIKADGFAGTTAKPSVLYVGTSGSVNQVWVRPDTGGPLTQTAYAGGGVVDLAVQPTDWQHVVVADTANVFRTTSAGASFANITGDLLTGHAGFSRVFSVETLHAGAADVYVAGGRDGVYTSTSDALGAWTEFGTGLPDCVVTDIDYDPVNDVLVVAALGRGVWSVPAFSTYFAPVPEPSAVLAFAAAALGVGRVVRRRGDAR